MIDAASPARVEQMREVDAVLEEIGAQDVPQLLVYNKVDRLDRPAAVARDACGSIDEVWLSAHTGEGLGLLRDAIAVRIAEREADRAQWDADADPAAAPVPQADARAAGQPDCRNTFDAI